MVISIGMIMLTLTTDEEIKDYLQKMIWERCHRTSWDQRDHKHICMFLYKSITEALQMVSWSSQTPPMIDAYFWDMSKMTEDKWLGILLSLQEYIVIRGEEYNIREGTAILTWSGEYRYEGVTSSREEILIKDYPQKCVITLIRRTSNLGEIRERRIKITEYDDRYDEEITKEFIVKNFLPEIGIIGRRRRLIKKPEVIRRNHLEARPLSRRIPHDSISTDTQRTTLLARSSRVV